MLRGIDKTVIFRDDRDNLKFLEKMGAAVTGGKCAVYAWVLMDNQVQLLFKSGEVGLSTVMRKVLTHQLHNFCSICEADMLRNSDQRYLTAHQPGQPAFLQNALKVKCTVMCIRI
jgi:hypothetical protein